MKKLTRKLFVSIMTLVLTAMALGTTTFAWFSMNTSVDATAMNVTAKSDALFLLIGDKSQETAAKIQAANGGNQRTVPGVACKYSAPATARTDYKVYPTYYAATASTLHGTTTVADHWYKGSSNDFNDSTSGASITDLNVSSDATKLDDYVVRYDFYLTVSVDSADISKQIIVAPTIGGFTGEYDGVNNYDALACVVKLNGETHNFTNMASTPATWTTTNPVSITSTTVVYVEVLVYINGESDATASANLDKLTGSLALKFTLVD